MVDERGRIHTGWTDARKPSLRDTVAYQLTVIVALSLAMFTLGWVGGAVLTHPAAVQLDCPSIDPARYYEDGMRP